MAAAEKTEALAAVEAVLAQVQKPQKQLPPGFVRINRKRRRAKAAQEKAQKRYDNRLRRQFG
jgi:hypothetical protein